jgi:uncharacterized protein YndB with AHSA1/START domain
MPVAPSGTDVVEHELRIGARPETVFSFFTDPVRMVQWMGEQATLDPRPGGACRIGFQPATAERVYAVAGEFIELEPYSRIVFTWGWEDEFFRTPPQSTAVEVTLTPDGDGTILRLTHRRLPPTAVGLHRRGWEHYLARLSTAAAGGDPGADPGIALG